MSWWLMTSASAGASLSVDKKNREVRIELNLATNKARFYKTAERIVTTIPRSLKDCRAAPGRESGQGNAPHRERAAAARGSHGARRFASLAKCGKMRSINQFAGSINA
ncbi:MAG: hypothetical protein KA223_01535 [Candidatus Accumulibacter sp.]|jgi:hypothetical protein|nr:hypothetical protein [Accumulibacter sp.]